MAYGKIKKMMNQFKGKQINSLERNMMRGLFTRKLKDYTEDVRNKSLIDRFFGQPEPNQDNGHSHDPTAKEPVKLPDSYSPLDLPKTFKKKKTKKGKSLRNIMKDPDLD